MQPRLEGLQRGCLAVCCSRLVCGGCSLVLLSLSWWQMKGNSTDITMHAHRHTACAPHLQLPGEQLISVHLSCCRSRPLQLLVVSVQELEAQVLPLLWALALLHVLLLQLVVLLAGRLHALRQRHSCRRTGILSIQA